MKQATRRFIERLLMMLMTVLVFSNQEAVLASNNSVWSGDPVVVTDTGEIRSVPDYREVHDIMTGLQKNYPEGMEWTIFTPYGRESAPYQFQGGSIKGASLTVGGSAFACKVSDTTFGGLPAIVIDQGEFDFEDIRIGDIIRTDGNRQFAIVWQINDDSVTVAEGAYHGIVHWGREVSKEECLESSFLVTRYPDYTKDGDMMGYICTKVLLKYCMFRAAVLDVCSVGDYLWNQK